MTETFVVGTDTFCAADSSDGRHSAFFEDDGDTGYFYALDLAEADYLILDAVHIYNVANVVDRERPFILTIIWSTDGSCCALLINDYPHAAFDFTARRGYCRTNFPNFPDKTEHAWRQSDHTWSDEAVAWLREQP